MRLPCILPPASDPVKLLWYNIVVDPIGLGRTHPTQAPGRPGGTVRTLISTQPGFPGPDAWDRFVAHDPHGHLLQTWAWGELKGAFGWSPLRIALEQDGSLVAGAQVLYRRLGPLSLAYVPKGPVLLGGESGAATALWEAIHRQSRRRGAISLKVEPEWRDEDADAHARLLAWGMQATDATVQPRRTIIVDLDADEDTLLARMKPKWRYNVRLSDRKGVVVREANDSMASFYQLLRLTGERDAFGIHTQAYYDRALRLFLPDQVRLLMAYYQEQPLAGLAVYGFNGQAWYMYGASSNAHRELMPNHQLQWRAMQWARQQGCSQYDLWGITDRDTEEGDALATLSGVERFKAGFGGEVVRFVGAYERAYVRPLHWVMGRALATKAGHG